MSPLFDVASVAKALDSFLAYAYPPIDLTPTILPAHTASRSSRRSALSVVLRDIDDTSAEVVALGEKLEEVLLGLRRRRAAVVTTLAPVSGLPTELLLEIFRIVIGGDRTARVQLALSHVSSLWRAVALDAKEFWTVIQVPSHAPEMFHEFAKRSGDLRLELSTFSGQPWPNLLEFTSKEASQLSLLESRHFLPAPLSMSLLDHASVMGLDNLVLTGQGHYHRIYDGLTSARSATFDDIRLSQVETEEIHMNRLTSLTIANSVVMNVSEQLELIRAPHLSQLKLVGITIGSQAGNDTEEPRLWGHGDQVTTFTLARSDHSTFFNVLAYWKMPNLVCLSLEFTGFFWSYADMDGEHWRLDRLLSLCPRIEQLHLVIPALVFCHFFGIERAPFLLPELKALSLLCTVETRSLVRFWHPPQPSYHVKDYLINALEIRSHQAAVQRLQHLIISSSFVEDKAEDLLEYAKYVDQVTIDQS